MLQFIEQEPLLPQQVILFLRQDLPFRDVFHAEQNGCAGAFFAPPFTGLDTLPALGVVLLSLGVLLEDFFIVVVGLVVGCAGVLLELVLGRAAVHGIGSLF